MSLWICVISYGVAIIGVAVAGAYLFCSRKYDHWQRKGVKHLKPLPFVGSMKDLILMRKSLGVILKEIYDEYKNYPFLGFYAFDEPILQLNDINLIKTVLIKDFQYFTDRNFLSNSKVDLLGSRSLLGLTGDHWKHSRNAITPSFTSTKMKRMYEIVSECGNVLTKALKKESGQALTAYELTARYTTDVIASCAFGIQCNTLENPHSEFLAKMKMIIDSSPTDALKFVTSFLCPKLLELTNVKVVNSEVEEYFINVIQSTIKYRQEFGFKRNDLLNSLLEIMNQGEVEVVPDKPKPKIKMDYYDVAAHSYMFLGAGFETSATTMSYALYELAKNPDAQDKLRKEIHTVLDENNGQIPYDTLPSMKYMDMVVQETLRKYPPVPFLNRVSSKSYLIPATEIKLEPGSVVVVPILAIHRDPEYYPDPLRFDPERFTDENKASRPPCTNMAFGEGPRACIGLRFALMQTKVGLSHILKNHYVHPCCSTPTEIEFTSRSFLSHPTKHVDLFFKRLDIQKY